MTDINNDFLHEMLRRLHQRFDRLEIQDHELRDDNTALRAQLLAFQGD